MGDIGLPELLVIFAIALLIFGPSKIGQLGKGLGEGIRHFKDGLKGDPDPPKAQESQPEVPKNG